MNPIFSLVRKHGIKVEFADLGEWGMDELRSEYDAQGPTIRLNLRVLETLPIEELGEYLLFSLGHELYHHREHCGEIERLADRAAREAAANEYARRLLAAT